MKLICNYATIKFVTWPHEPEKDLAASRKFSCSHPIEEWSLYFSLSGGCRFGLSESGFWTKYLSVRNNERKKSEILRRGEWGGGAWKCPHFQKSEYPSEWECQFQSLGYAFCQGAGACFQLIEGMSVIARSLQGESRLNLNFSHWGSIMTVWYRGLIFQI